MSIKHIILLFTLLIAAMVPYCYAACCVVPLADDYCMAWEAIRHPNLFSSVSHMYLHWNGRYTADILVMLNPFIRYGRTGYELASLLMIAIGISVNYIIARRIIEGEPGRWCTALIVQLLFLFQLPDLSEGIFWYNGYMLYYLPVLVFAIALLLTVDAMSARAWNAMAITKAVTASLLIFIIAGFNEPVAVISMLFFAALCVYGFNRYKHARLFFVLWLLVSVSGVLIVWLAPGNRVRASQFHFDRSIVKVVLMTHLQIVRFIADWISNLPFIFLSIVVLVRAGKMNAKWIDGIKLWWIGASLYIVMVLCIMLPYWFTGVLGQQRTVNMAYAFFIPLASIALFKISRERFVFRVLSFMSSERVMVTMVAASIVFMMVTKNGYKLGYDMAYGNLSKYKSEQIAREELLRNNLHNDTFKLAPIENRPLSITLYDERNPKFYWVEECERQYLLEEVKQRK